MYLLHIEGIFCIPNLCLSAFIHWDSKQLCWNIFSYCFVNITTELQTCYWNLTEAMVHSVFILCFSNFCLHFDMSRVELCLAINSWHIYLIKDIFCNKPVHIQHGNDDMCGTEFEELIWTLDMSLTNSEEVFLRFYVIIQYMQPYTVRCSNCLYWIAQ